MMEDPATGALSPIDFNSLQESIPELNRFDMNIDWVSFTEPIDSSNANPDTWVSIVNIISQRYDEYTGFVILHGTDTMAYTASALSFMLENLGKPVVLTGSQLPMGRLRTDGKENLITALEIAGMMQDKQPLLNEVMIYFEDFLFRGNRTFKYNADHFDAFDSPNYPVLGTTGIHIHINRKQLFPRPARPLIIRRKMISNIAVFNFFPGVRGELLKSVIDTPGLKALILHSYGAGNVPQEPWLRESIIEAQEKGIIVVNLSQCLKGFVEQGRYATSSLLAELGVWNAGDMTLEATITKLMYLMGVDLNQKERELAFHADLRGERTISTSLV